MAEALCEFTFNSDTDWDLAFLVQLQIDFRDEYCGKPTEINIQTIQQQSASNIALTNDLRIRFPTKDGTKMVTVGKETVAVNVLRPYEGWENFKPRIERALSSYWMTAKPKSVRRIGLRYINRLQLDKARAEPSTYFYYSMPEALNAKLENFLWRSEYQNEDLTKVLITFASVPPEASFSSAFLLDIDVIWDHSELKDLPSIMDATEQLHSIEGRAFEAIITNEARNFFDAA